MRHFKALLIASLMLLLAGCATQKISQTATGRPEVSIYTSDIDAVKSELMMNFGQHGFMLEQDSQYSMFFTKQMEGSQAMFAQMLIGNSYSTTPKAEIRINISQMKQRIDLVAFLSMSTQMAFGQVNRQDMGGNGAWFNDIQSVFNNIKSKFQPSDASAQTTTDQGSVESGPRKLNKK